MLKTYTFYLRDGGDDVRFEPAMCLTDAQAMAHAHLLLKTHTPCYAIEVFFGRERLFSVGREAYSLVGFKSRGGRAVEPPERFKHLLHAGSPHFSAFSVGDGAEDQRTGWSSQS